MRRLAISAVLGLLVGVAWADGKAPPGGAKSSAVASCNVPASGMCWDYAGYDPRDLSTSRKSCAQISPGKGTWAEGQACPATRRVGRCTRTMLGTTTVINFYPPSTSKQAEDHCTMIGVPFTPN
jgi:hypothetical protein